MAIQNAFMRQYYDRILAAVVLLAVIGSLLYIIIGLPAAKAEGKKRLSSSAPKGPQIQVADLSAYETHLAHLAQPTEDALLRVEPPSQPNLFTPDHRVLCIKCGAPIPFASDICPYGNCRAEQPKEKVIDPTTRDSDGDGLYDLWEIKYGLDPNDPADADLDKDNDGFTNKEEFDAGTDPTDPTSHPSYIDRLSVREIAGNKATLRLTNMMKLPETTLEDGTVIPHMMAFFYRLDADGKYVGEQIRVKDGEKIGKTGFTFVAFKEHRPTITVGKNNQKRLINASTVDIKRDSDGKVCTLTFFDEKNPKWPGEPLIEQTATLAVEGVPGVETISIIPDSTFKVKDEAYTVLSIQPEQKTVEVKRMADSKRFSLK